MNRILFLAIIFISIISCTPDEKKTVDEVTTTNLQEKATVSRIGITLSPKAKKEVAGWEKYQLIATKMQRYQSITKSEALQNARELSLLIEDASDTIDVKALDRPDVKMRFNVLYNYAFRLYDMLSIPSITKEEVMTEVTGLLDAFSAVNDKINVVYKIDEYKKLYGITELDTSIFVGKGNMMRDVEIAPNEELAKPDKSENKTRRLIQPVNKELVKKSKKVPFKKTHQLKKE